MMTGDGSSQPREDPGDIGLYDSYRAYRYWMFVRLIVICIGGGLMTLFLFVNGLLFLAIPMSMLAFWAGLTTAELAFGMGYIVLHTRAQTIEAKRFLARRALIDVRELQTIRLRPTLSRINTKLVLAGEQEELATVAIYSEDIAKWAQAVVIEGGKSGISITTDVERPTWKLYPKGYPGTYTFMDARPRE